MRWRFSASGHRTAHRSMRIRRLWTLLSDPASSKSAYAVSIVSLSAVIIMSAILCLETMPDVQGDTRAQLGLWAIEAACTAVFVLEYVGKLVSAPSRLKFMLSLEAVVDVVTILPFFVGLGICRVQSCGASNGSLKVMLVRSPPELNASFLFLIFCHSGCVRLGSSAPSVHQTQGPVTPRQRPAVFQAVTRAKRAAGTPSEPIWRMRKHVSRRLRCVGVSSCLDSEQLVRNPMWAPCCPAGATCHCSAHQACRPAADPAHVSAVTHLPRAQGQPAHEPRVPHRRRPDGLV